MGHRNLAMAKTRTETFLETSGIEQSAGPFLVGFSGGLDSTVLLHLLSTRSRSSTKTLRAIHVHHGLHPDADAWARHCQAFCATLGIEFMLAPVEVARDGGRGLEAAARDARYACFAQHLRSDETLALAHHQDDQAETVLLRLLRASASQGLSAMRGRRPFANGLLWRPLLAIPRSALLEYAQAHRLNWIEDPSNVDQSLDRNFLRHRITPVLAERWPHAAAALARSAELLAEDAELLRGEADKRLAEVRGSDHSILSTASLLAEEKPWRTRMLRLWLEELGLPPLPRGALDIIETEVLRARPDAEPEYRWAGAVLRGWRGLLRAGLAKSGLPADWCCEWHTE
jgi:tRNA(Ile)-lysidine synthase